MKQTPSPSKFDQQTFIFLFNQSSRLVRLLCISSFPTVSEKERCDQYHMQPAELGSNTCGLIHCAYIVIDNERNTAET
jgi:hypothetical protein